MNLHVKVCAKHILLILKFNNTRANLWTSLTCWLLSESLSNFSLVLEIDMPAVRLPSLVL
jgi:hypothetical protein